jgi:hypothetical protein
LPGQNTSVQIHSLAALEKVLGDGAFADLERSKAQGVDSKKMSLVRWNVLATISGILLAAPVVSALAVKHDSVAARGCMNVVMLVSSGKHDGAF